VTRQRFVSGSATFGAAAVLSRLAPLLLLPLFTRVLTPAEYGQLGVLATLGALMTVIAGFGLETAMLRGFIQSRADPAEGRLFVNTVGAFSIAFAFALAGVLAVAVGGLAEAVGVPVDALRLTLVASAATASTTVVPLALLRAQERFGDYLRLSIVSLVATFGLAILFVALLQMGVMGWVVASVAGGIGTLGVGLVILGHPWSREFEPAALERAVRFGVPLVPHALAQWGLGVSDRLILGAIVASAAIGPYFVSYQASGAVLVAAIAMSQSAQPMFAEALRSEERRRQVARTSTLHAIIVCLTASAVALAAPPLIDLVLPPPYAPSGDYIPWMALGFAFFGLYLIPMNAIAVMAGRTERVWVITLLAAACNVGINLAFVPAFGPMAAAISTAIGYGVLLVGVTTYMTRVVSDPIPFERGRLAIGLAIVAGTTLVALIVRPTEAWTALAVGVGAVLVAGAIVARAVFPQELSMATRVIGSRVGTRAP
jgi:O-antigen/teichoic acid export membrane protein